MESRELTFDPSHLRFDGIIGTGGIGSGKFFVVNGDHTLGREESRSGHFLDIRDYCKQHIILHYVKVLLGPRFIVLPIGKIGDDDIGKVLFTEMQETGFVMKRISTVSQASTLFSFCFYYPDGSGGNLTTDNSASSKVDAEDIKCAVGDIKALGKRGIIMAAPEVPLEARQMLIEMGSHYGLFCTASFTTGEFTEVLKSDILNKTDLLAINIDEASALAGIKSGTDVLSSVKQSVKTLQQINSNMLLSITAGKEGSWCWDGNRLNWFPSVNANAVSTAGAGDAFFSGLITGLTIGLNMFEAQQLASLIAGLSVCSPHTIHKGIERNSLRQFLISSGMKFSEKILKLLEE